MDRKACSVPEAAELLGLGRSAGYAAAKTGQLPTIKVGRRLLVPFVKLDELLGGTGNPPVSQTSAELHVGMHARDQKAKPQSCDRREAPSKVASAGEQKSK